MKYINEAFPIYHEEFSECYNIELINNTNMIYQNKALIILFLSIFYFLCFILGVIMFTYHNFAFKYFFYFLLFLIFLSLIVIPLHLFLHTLTLPSKNFEGSIVFGFDKSKFNFFAYYKNKLTKFRLLLSLLLPFIALTIIPTVVIILTPATMYLYAIICLNTILSVFDLYDCYILIVKGRTKEKKCFYIKSGNFIYRLREKTPAII